MRTNSPRFYHFCVTAAHVITVSFCPILASLLSLSTCTYCQPQGGWDSMRKRKEERIIPKTRELHELPYMQIVKYETGFTFFRSSIKMPGIFNGHHLLFVRTVYRACILKPLEAFLQACSLPPNFQPVIGMHFCKAGFTNSQLVTGQAPSLDEARSFR